MTIEELREATRDMTAPALLRFLVVDKFPDRTIVTCSLRARSVVLLKMIAEIDPTTPVVFCHALKPYPESLEYRARLVSLLGLRDIRDPGGDEAGPLPGDCDHSEGLWAEDPVDHTRAYTVTHLNRTLADCDCWISGVYHGPYTSEPGPRVRAEGRLIRVDPLADWTLDDVRRFMSAHKLPYHPRAPLRHQEPASEEANTVPTYHF